MSEGPQKSGMERRAGTRIGIKTGTKQEMEEEEIKIGNETEKHRERDRDRDRDHHRDRHRDRSDRRSRDKDDDDDKYRSQDSERHWFNFPTETASSAKYALDGRIIPRYLLPEHVGSCTLRITYSAHTNLSVKFQFHRSGYYTNPYLPVAPSAIDAGGQIGKGTRGDVTILLTPVVNNHQYRGKI